MEEENLQVRDRDRGPCDFFAGRSVFGSAIRLRGNFLVAIFFVGFWCGNALPSEWPFSISVLPFFQFPSEDTNVAGLRLTALWGKHKRIHGVDLSFGANSTEGRFVGIGLSGLLNVCSGENLILGLQAAGLMNWNGDATVLGAQLGSLLNWNASFASKTETQNP